MFGGSPGTWDFKASLLARHGYVSLALAFHGKGLEEVHPPAEKGVRPPTFKMAYFDKAIELLYNHPKVNRSCGGIGVVTISGSTPFGLFMSVHSDLVKCVILTNGPVSNNLGMFITEDKTYPYIQYFGKEATLRTVYEEGHPGAKQGLAMRSMTGPIVNISPEGVTNPPGANIPYYDQKHVGFLYLAALNDENTPSEYYANVFERCLKNSGHPNFKVVRFAGAGHVMGEPPYGPHNYISWFPFFGHDLIWGGKTKQHCKAMLSAWRETLKFLESNLKS